MTDIAKKGNWSAYKGWSDFEKVNLLKPYLGLIKRAAHDTESKRIVSVGIGPGFPENLLLEEGISILGIDNNKMLLDMAESVGVETRLLDLFDIPNHDDLKEVTSVLVATFLVHNIDPNEMNNLYKVFSYMLKPKGKLITIDPYPDYEHIKAFNDNTFREVFSKEGDKLDSNCVNPEKNNYIVEINLDNNKQGSVIRHEHRSLSKYIESLKENGFIDIKKNEVGIQEGNIGKFPAYLIIEATKN